MPRRHRRRRSRSLAGLGLTRAQAGEYARKGAQAAAVAVIGKLLLWAGAFILIRALGKGAASEAVTKVASAPSFITGEAPS